MFSRLLPLFLIFVLAGCGSFRRSDDAAVARQQMIGYSREDVMACMGPPKKKATQDSVEVWQYLSTDGSHESTFSQYKYGSSYGSNMKVGGGAGDKSFCTVNIVIRNNAVSAVNYNGPTSSSLFADDEQCGYAVKNCVHAGYGNAGYGH
ncbi:MAG: hypothetical protein P4M15_13580 [Alphaproteobacteria bacterium]|nr:hypothetical protein [Alphaproteobacteria bacterium]